MSEPGSDVPLLRKVGERSPAPNSCAIDLLDVTSLATASLAVSPAASTFGNHSLCDSLSHPPSSSAPAAPNARARKSRRGIRVSVMTGLTFDAIAAADHRSQIVPESGHDDLENMDRHKAHQQPRGNEMDRPRRLPTSDEVDPSRH